MLASMECNRCWLASEKRCKGSTGCSTSIPIIFSNKFFSANLKSFKWYAYNTGLPAEFRWESIMQNNVNFPGTWQLGQNALMQLMVYSGNQQIIKNNTMIERFCVAFTSRLRDAPKTRNMVPPWQGRPGWICAFELRLLSLIGFMVTICLTWKYKGGFKHTIYLLLCCRIFSTIPLVPTCLTMTR